MNEQHVEQVALMVAQWYPVVGQLATLGVRSFHLIRAMIKESSQQDEDVDTAVLALLEKKWDDLYNRVDMAAEGRTK